MRAADPGERALVAEERVQAPVVAGEDLAQPLDAEPERLGPEMRELGLRLRGGLEPDARPLLRATLGQDELAPFSKRSRNAGVFGPFAPGARNLIRPALIR